MQKTGWYGHTDPEESDLKGHLTPHGNRMWLCIKAKSRWIDLGIQWQVCVCVWDAKKQKQKNIDISQGPQQCSTFEFKVMVNACLTTHSFTAFWHIKPATFTVHICKICFKGTTFVLSNLLFCEMYRNTVIACKSTRGQRSSSHILKTAYGQSAYLKYKLANHHPI